MDQVKKYWPLIVLISVSALMAGILGRTNPNLLMHAFMGFSLILFATLKLFNPSKFADGFQMYDLLARYFRPYAYIYPLLELALGIAWFTFLEPKYTAWATIALFGFGAIGVLIAIKNKLNVNCACMGNVLQVPLSTVTLFEDFLMIGMSAAMLYNIQ